MKSPINTLADPDWAVTMFSFTSELITGNRTPLQLMEDLLDSNVTNQIEIDAPQHFASYPRISDQEASELRDVVERHGARLSLLGIYNDSASRRTGNFSLDEAEEYIADQIRAAADMGFRATRIMFGTDFALLERLAPHAEKYGIPVLQEVQGSATPNGQAFETQLDNIDRIGSNKLGFVFDLSACMPELPVTFLESLRRDNVPADVVRYLEEQWPTQPGPDVQARLDIMTEKLNIAPATRSRLAMPFGRFGHSQVSDWREHLGRFQAIHLKYWDVEDDGKRVSGPIGDLRREFGAIDYDGVITSEWGGHEWFRPEDPNAIEMSKRHRALYDAALG